MLTQQCHQVVICHKLSELEIFVFYLVSPFFFSHLLGEVVISLEESNVH